MNQQINLDMQICSASSKQDPMHNLEAKVKSRFADFGMCMDYGQKRLHNFPMVYCF
jgi:hypothetical protein